VIRKVLQFEDEKKKTLKAKWKQKSAKEKVSLGIEPRLAESESAVITITLGNQDLAGLLPFAVIG
jgi:hypothetical protein